MANVVEIQLRVLGSQAESNLQRFEGKLMGLGGSLLKLGASMGVASAITDRLIGSLSQAAGAVAQMPFALADTVEQLDRLALRTGVSSENLQVMQRIIRESGGNSEALTTALSFLNRAIAEGNPVLAQLGITTTDTFRAFMQLADLFARSDDAAKKNWISFKLLGRGGAELISEMTSVAQSFRATRSEMLETQGLITEKVAPAARALDQSMNTLANNWESATTRMKAALVPWANAALEAFNRIAENANKADIGETGSGGRRGADIVRDAESRARRRSFGERDRDLNTGWTADIVAGVKTDEAKESPRAKRLEEIRTLLNLSAVAAERVLQRLEAIEGHKKAQQILDALHDARPIEQRLEEAAAFTPQQMNRRGVTGAPDVATAVDDLRKVPEKQLDALTQVRVEWEAFVEEVLSASSILDESLSGLWNGLQGGFGTVFRNLTNETQTFASAMKTIFEALVQEVLAMLARIAAAPAGVGGGSAIIGGTSAARAPVGAAGNVHVTINSLDARTALEQVVSPFGILRTAELRAAEAFA